MLQTYELISKNKIQLIEFASVKNYLRVDHEFDDEYIRELIDTAVEVAENYLSIILRESKWKVILNSGSLPERLKLNRYIINKIDFIKITKNNDDVFYLNKNQFFFDSTKREIFFNLKINIKKCEIDVSSGYNSVTLPKPLKQGMLEHIAQMYDLRGQNHGLSLSVKSLYQPYKNVRI